MSPFRNKFKAQKNGGDIRTCPPKAATVPLFAVFMQ